MIEGTGVTSSVSILTRMRVFWRRRQQMIDDVEALLARRPVDRRDVDEADELAARIVAQEASATSTMSARVAVMVSSPNATRTAGTAPAERAATMARAELVERRRPSPPHRSIVPVRRIFFCSSSTP